MQQRVQKDWYAILEVSAKSSLAEVKKSYRRLVREYHPDAAGGPKDDRSFHDIQEAYEVLSDPKKRAAYDQARSGPASAESKLNAYRKQQSEGWSTRRQQTEQIFEEDSPAARNSTDSPESIISKLAGSVRSAFGGGTKDGLRKNAQTLVRALKKERVFHFSVDALESLHGTTRELSIDQAGGPPRRVRVKIPPGVRSGETLVVNCPKTETHPEQRLRVRIEVTSHALIERDGLDITVKIPVSVLEALNGVELQVPTLHGPVKVKIPEGWDEGKKLRLKGKGLAEPGSQAQGDLYVRIYVVLPPRSSDAVAIAEHFEPLYQTNIRSLIPTKL